MNNLILLCLLFTIFLSFLPVDTSAHRSGCHRWHTCASDSGSYGCGDLGYDCKYSSTPSNSTSVASGVGKGSLGASQLNNPSPQPLSPSTSPSSVNSQADTPQLIGGVECGQIVRGTITLDTDLICPQDGLIVGKEHTVINLNGHSITGPGQDTPKVGIAITNSNYVIIQGNGSIHNFQAGVLISGSEGAQVREITFDGNKIGVFSTGSPESTVRWNHLASNTIGVGLRSSSVAQVSDNKMIGNSLAGLTLVNTDKSKVDSNSINGSNNGIMIDSDSTTNVVLNNNAFNNSVDINNAEGLPLNVNNNEFLSNYCSVSQPAGYCNNLESGEEVYQIQAAIADEISMLDGLRKQGVLTDQEFLTMKQSLIDGNP